MTDKIKVLHVLWSGGIGGTEEYITTLVKQMDPLKYHSSLCFISGKGAIYNEVSKINNNIAFIGMNNGFDILGALKLIRYLYKGRFDIIHSHSSNIMANIIIALFKKPKKVFTEHVSPGARHLFKKRKIFYRLLGRRFHRIIAISGYVKSKLVEEMHLHPERITVIYNGISLDKFNNLATSSQDIVTGIDNSSSIIGFVGRMADFKRPILFVDVARELIKKNNNFYFIMVGDGPELEKCRDKIQQYQINEKFKLMGFRRDIPAIMRSFDALFFTSSGEGFGIVLIEAMAMGIPVFAINDGAVPEIIKHRNNGILINTLDSKIIARQLLEVMEDKSLMARIKNNCVSDVRSKYSIQASVRETEKLYQQLLSDAAA